MSKHFLIRHRLRFLLLSLALAGLTAQASATPVAFVHVNVVPMDVEHVVPDTTVIVDNGVIQAIGPDAAVPEGAQMIDGHKTAYLSPGLADMHVHSATSTEMSLYLTYGVTSVLNMGGASAEFVGQAVPLINAGKRPGPHVYLALRVDGSQRYGNLRVSTPEQAGAVVSLARDNGYQFIKVYNDLSPEVFQAFIEAGRRQGLPVVGHGVTAVGLARQLAAGQVMVAHLEEFLYTVFPATPSNGQAPPDDAIASVVAMVKQTGAYVTADLFTYRTIAAQWGRPDVVHDFLATPEARLLSPDERMAWPDADYDRREGSLAARASFLGRFARALDRAGVPLIAGTDAPSIPGVFPGRALHDDLDSLHAAGFTAYEALSTATRIPGRFITDTIGGTPFGTVTVGSRADLVLTANNPLTDFASLRHPLGVMAAGTWYTADSLARLRERVRARYGRACD